MTRWIAIVATLGLAGGCVEKSNTKDKQKQPPPASAPATPPSKAVAKRPTPPPKPAQPPKAPAPRETPVLCKNLLPVPVVERLVGTKGFAPTPRGAARLRPGTGQCDYWIAPDGGKGPPKASVGLRIDCNAGHMKRERLIKALEGGPQKRKYEKVGDWIYITSPRLHSMWAWSKVPSCMLSITTGGIVERKVDAMVKHVFSKLTPATAPK